MTKAEIENYYRRPFVAKIRKVFDFPRPPTFLTEQPFDHRIEDLEAIAFKEWHEIRREHWIVYLENLAHQPNQQDLFDHLFPYFLILWREGLMIRESMPSLNEYDLYRGLARGKVLDNLMTPKRKQQVLDWMAEGFLQGVDSLTAEDTLTGVPIFYHYTLNALGQTVPIMNQLLDGLLDGITPAQARYWITFSAGLCWPKYDVPWAGHLSLLESHGYLDHEAFLSENLQAYRERVSVEIIRSKLFTAREIGLDEAELALVNACLEWMDTYPKATDAKFAWVLDNLGKPGLGNHLQEPSF